MKYSATPPKRTITPSRSQTSKKHTQSRSPFSRSSHKDDLVEEKLRNNREKLGHTLDTYTMLIRSRHPIRCLEHNSIVSIYCETQNRLLCTNCIFGKNDHKFHKMTPIDKSQAKLIEDIEKMTLQVESEARTIGTISDMILSNLLKDEKEIVMNLDIISSKYSEAHALLDQCFFAIKDRLINSIEKEKIKHETVIIELNFLKTLYTPNAEALAEFKEVDGLQQILYQHCILSTLNKQRKFFGNVYEQPRSKVRDLFKEELERIRNICDDLKKTLAAWCQS